MRNGGDVIAEVLDRLARPYGPTATIETFGLAPRIARELVGRALATGAEAEALLDSMPRTIRSLAIATTDTPIRCHGELRGPVLWSETVSSRSASAGDAGLFVCASPARAFDTDENRVLVAALAAVRTAAEDAEAGPGTQDDVVRRARHNAARAIRFLEHRALADLPRRRPSGRALRRTRSGNRRNTYQPALAMLRRAAEPIGADDLSGFIDPEVQDHLALLVTALDAAERSGAARGGLRARHHGLEAGPVRFAVTATEGRPTAIVTVGGQRVHTPDEARLALAQPRSRPPARPTSTTSR